MLDAALRRQDRKRRERIVHAYQAANLMGVAPDKLTALLDGTPAAPARRQTSQEMLDVLKQWQAVQTGVVTREKASAGSAPQPRQPVEAL